MLNKEVYREGDKQFRELFNQNRWDELEEAEFEELMERMAEGAIYDDNCGIDSDELGYYVVAEVYGIDEANKYLEFRNAA